MIYNTMQTAYNAERRFRRFIGKVDTPNLSIIRIFARIFQYSVGPIKQLGKLIVLPHTPNGKHVPLGVELFDGTRILYNAILYWANSRRISDNSRRISDKWAEFFVEHDYDLTTFIAYQKITVGRIHSGAKCNEGGIVEARFGIIDYGEILEASDIGPGGQSILPWSGMEWSTEAEGIE